MKFRHALYLLVGLVLLSFTSSYFGEELAPRSLKRIYVPYMQAENVCGSGHGFGYGLVYTIVEHKVHNGKVHAVIKSDEPGVEICSPIPQVVAMVDGAKFHVLKGAGNLDEAIQRISLKNR